MRWTRLPCPIFAPNRVRLQLPVLANNLDSFPRRLALPRRAKHWTLTTLRDELVKIGSKVVHQARCVASQRADVAVPGRPYRADLGRMQ